MTAPVRTLVVWCPDWPLVAAGVGPDVPAATFRANRVVACTAAARAEGVSRGLRRREAQGRCPELAIEAHDPARDARAFESVIAALERFTPQVEVTRPGMCAIATRGPSRYFGGDEALAAKVKDIVDEALPETGPSCQVGVADGPFAAALAARRSLVIPRGETPEFLAPLPIVLLDEPELTDLLIRLGVRTLGAFAALDPGDVLDRFGPIGQVAHRRARGLDERTLDCRVPPQDLSFEVVIDPPADRVDIAAFAAKSIADQLCAALSESAMVCTCIRIEAQTEHGEHLTRLWRHHRAFTPHAVAERVRWQLEGWLAMDADSYEDATTGGLTLLRLAPEEIRPDTGRQEGFWGGVSTAEDRAARGFARVQGLLGPDAVVTAVLGGGRGPADQVRLVPWGEPRDAAPPRSREPTSRQQLKRSTRTARPGTRVRTAGRNPSPTEVPAWPGRLPSPSPMVVPRSPLPAEVQDADGIAVGVTSRSLLTSEPARLSIQGGRWEPITSWSGPWTFDERWWDPKTRRRFARFQMVLATGAAHLVTLERGQWWIEASYD